jgi:hypothetical protein
VYVVIVFNIVSPALVLQFVATVTQLLFGILALLFVMQIVLLSATVLLARFLTLLLEIIYNV